MPYKKGISGNINGRKRGSRNRATSDLRQWVANFIDDNREQIQEDFKLLEPRDRLIFLERLLKYVLPTLQATSVTTNKEEDKHLFFGYGEEKPVGPGLAPKPN